MTIKSILYLFQLINIINAQITYYGPASTDYFQQESSKFNNTDHLPSLTCNKEHILFTTNESDPVIYYSLQITPTMKELYHSSIYLSTCDYMLCDPYKPPTSEYCSDTSFKLQSLDTIIYILQQNKAGLDIVEYNDDSSGLCWNPGKSYIDIYDYTKGDYIVAVGGFGDRYGSYYLEFECAQYSKPIVADELILPLNPSAIHCNDTLYGTVNTSHPVEYYILSINTTLNNGLPLFIETGNSSMYVYLVEDSINTVGITAWSYGGYLEVEDEHMVNFDKYTYYIVVQGLFEYMLSVLCTVTEVPTLDPTLPPPKEQLDSLLIAGIVFGICGVIFVLGLAYYIYEWIQYSKNVYEWKKRPKQTSSGTFSAVTQNDDEEEEPEPKTVSPYFKDEVKYDAWLPSRRSSGTVAGVSIRRFDFDKDITSQLDCNEDVVQCVLAHAIQCCSDQNGLDIYQVLAIRYYEKDSRDIVGREIFRKIGIHMRFVKLSPYFTTFVQAVIIALTQLWGITVVVYKLIDEYFGEYENDCNMDQERWHDVWSLKVLSFLLSLVITFFIRILMNGVSNNGLYKMVDELELHHVKRVSNVSILIVQIGQMVNYYTCLWAILGSYFIIFEGNRGDKHDDGSTNYANTGLEMILNAVALFFMLELDDMMVTQHDYADCQAHLERILTNYKPDISINEYYRPSLDILPDTDPKQKREDSIMADKFNNCIIPFMYHFVHVFGFVVTFCCYCGGFIAPFIIFFCW